VARHPCRGADLFRASALCSLLAVRGRQPPVFLSQPGYRHLGRRLELWNRRGVGEGGPAEPVRPCRFTPSPGTASRS